MGGDFKKLLKGERFFELRERLENNMYELSTYKRLYYEAYLHNVFGRAEESNIVIDQLFERYAKRLRKSRRKAMNLLMIRLDNDAKRAQYGRCMKTARHVLDKYRKSIDKQSRKDLLNSLALWSVLGTIPSQQIVTESSSGVPISRNNFNHWIIQVRADRCEESIPFVFDSGANISTIRRSVAIRMGVHFTGSTVEVNNSVGTTVGTECGYIPRLMIGDMVVENIMVLIMPDASLTFDDLGYSIDGIIGFPVIRALGEFSISGDGWLRISPQDVNEPRRQNMFQKGMLPFVEVWLDGERLTMVLDTGAAISQLSRRYYKKHRVKIKKYSAQATVSIGGAGATKEFCHHRLKDKSFEVSGKTIALPSVNVMMTNTFRDKKNDGFMGQDMLLHSGEVVMNFHDMYLYFRD